MAYPCWAARLAPSIAPLRRSSLKERGRVKSVRGLVLGSGAYLLACLDGRRGQGSGEARPRSGRRALGPAPGGVENVGRRGVAERWWFWAWVLHLGDVGVMGLVLVSVDALRGGDSPVAGVSHPFAGRLCTRRRA